MFQDVLLITFPSQNSIKKKQSLSGKSNASRDIDKSSLLTVSNLWEEGEVCGWFHRPVRLYKKPLLPDYSSVHPDKKKN